MASNTVRPHRGPRANPKGAIQDWLTLVDPDGAFLTTTELYAVFPNGFEPMAPEVRTELRARVAEITDDPVERADLRSWLMEVVLEWDDLIVDGQQIPATASARTAEGVDLRPDHVLLDADDSNRVRLGVFTWPLGTALERRADVAVVGDSWAASPVQRAEAWCREAGTPLALVTDDDRWVLVWAPRGAPAASARWSIADLADERILQAGLVSILGARRFFAVSDDAKTGETIERLFERAADAEAELTKGLGSSVRQSVELLVAAISRDDVASKHQVLEGVSNEEVYESAVTVLMRLVFLLFAEERQLLPSEDPLWAESYSVLTLRDDLRVTSTRDGEDALERRSTAWHRLLATFRAVHGGVNHDRLSLPAYGGSLFDPERFPFLEGWRHPDHIFVNGVDIGPADDAAFGPGRPIAIDDRTVLAILDALLTVQVKSGRTKVAQRVSYKALEVEQIGHCYEGLLDHGCAPVDVLSVGLIGPEGHEPEFTVDDLDEHAARGDDALAEWLSDKTRCNRTAAALAKEMLKEPEGVELARLRVACGHDDGHVARVLPYWGLIRFDLRGLPIVFLPGSKYVTQTSTRRNMGAQYTTKALAEEVVQYALEPLVFDPGPQNEPDQTKWKLKTPEKILDLRVCDPAVGSGAILTAAGRYLANRLVESVVEYGPGDGRFAVRLQAISSAPADEQEVLARREVVDHCLYGVDKNPVAAEMAKLSLWLTTMARERPFTFLDHAIQVGDSLLGITDIDQLRWLHLDPSERRGQRGFESLAIESRVKEATELARELREMSVITVRDASEKQRLNQELRTKLADLSVVADAIVGAALSTSGKSGTTFADRLGPHMDRIRIALDERTPLAERGVVLETLRGIAVGWLRTDLPDDVPVSWERQCLHWALAFPEIFLDADRAGFDATVGNPPFLGGKRISTANGLAFREYLVSWIAGDITGNADLVVYFLLRSCTIAGSVGTLATNTISQADTREVGLDRLLTNGWEVTRAVKTAPWPNEAGVEIAKLWLWHGNWQGIRRLGGEPVRRITPTLDPEGRASGPPERLSSNSGQSFVGCALNTTGFIITEEEAKLLLDGDPRNHFVVKPYLNGADLNNDPRLRPARWVIDFSGMNEGQARQFAAPFNIVADRVRPEVLAKTGYPGWDHRWWQFWNTRAGMRSAISSLSRILVITRVSKTVVPAFVPNALVPSEQTVVFAFDDDEHLGLLTSVFQWWWAHAWCSTMRSAGLRYSATDAYETFPLPCSRTPELWHEIGILGRALDDFRSGVMVDTNLGLTKTYNRVHDPEEHTADIQRLRQLHIELDHAVRDAYGWSDLTLNHHHWDTPQGMRFTVSSNAKDELLDRLLELNHQRYAEEVAAGLHSNATKRSADRSRKKKSNNSDQGSLL